MKINKESFKILPYLTALTAAIIEFAASFNGSLSLISASIVLCGIATVLYFVSIFISPMRDGVDIVCEIMLIVLLHVVIYGPLGTFSTLIPYSLMGILYCLLILLIDLTLFIVRLSRFPLTRSQSDKTL